MIRRVLLGLLAVASVHAGAPAGDLPSFSEPPHNYWKRPLTDRFTQLRGDLESGRLVLDDSSERAFVLSLLKALDVPATSQMLVFSTTSLQLRLITPSTPRALYFNEDLYVGYVQRGKIEIVSIDPEAGGIYYIFDIPRNGQSVRVERADRCMNCHAGAELGRVPGLLVKSVVPGPSGGSLEAFRQEETGHSVPLDQRFGGWYLTGPANFTNHWGNIVGRLSPQGLQKNYIPPGRYFDFTRYPVATSDLLPQLLHEHQAGFVNRTVAATYRTRALLDMDKGSLTPAHAAQLDDEARTLTRYILFADEAKLPAGGVPGDAAFKADFLRNRRAAKGGASLKDLELRTRLLQNRCSYMIYSAVFTGLPAEMKQRVFRRLGEALNAEKPDREFAYLPVAEKRAIRAILKETLADLPRNW